jgi:hypothetical protein
LLLSQKFAGSEFDKLYFSNKLFKNSINNNFKRRVFMLQFYKIKTFLAVLSLAAGGLFVNAYGADCSRQDLVQLKNGTIHPATDVTTTVVAIQQLIQEDYAGDFWQLVHMCKHPRTYHRVSDVFNHFGLTQKGGKLLPVVRDIILSGITQDDEHFENPVSRPLSPLLQDAVFDFEPIPLPFEPLCTIL